MLGADSPQVPDAPTGNYETMQGLYTYEYFKYSNMYYLSYFGAIFHKSLPTEVSNLQIGLDSLDVWTFSSLAVDR